MSKLKNIRSWLKRCICLIAVIFIIYLVLNINIQVTYLYRFVGRCINTEEEDQNLLYLIKSTHEVMDKLNIDHFLLYGRCV